MIKRVCALVLGLLLLNSAMALAEEMEYIYSTDGNVTVRYGIGTITLLEYSYDQIHWEPVQWEGDTEVVFSFLQPFNGKSFVVNYDMGPIGGYSEDGVHWTPLEENGDWAGGPLNCGGQFIWIGTGYLAARQGYSDGVAGSLPRHGPKTRAVALLDETFHVIGEYTLGEGVAVSYVRGTCWAASGDEAQRIKLWSSPDGLEWTPTTRTYLPTAETIDVTLDGEFMPLERSPYLKNDRVMVPLRELAENLGFEVDWDQAANRASCVRGDVAVTVDVGTDRGTVNGIPYTLDAAAEIDDYQYRTYVPLRFFSEALGLNVEWDQTTRTAILTTELG